MAAFAFDLAVIWLSLEEEESEVKGEKGLLAGLGSLQTQRGREMREKGEIGFYIIKGCGAQHLKIFQT